MKRLAQFVFFVSGFAALVYQIVWQRLLIFFGGADVYSVTIIVSAFMAGLGFGSVAGGNLADRLGQRGRLLGFAAAELAICLFALASAGLFYDVLYVRLGPLGLSRPTLAVILFIVLLWPTFFMGMSLPLLARALSDNDRLPAQWVSGLYGWNTLGAACGSLAAVWVLFRSVDFRTAISVGALLSFGCTCAAVILAWFIRDTPPIPESRHGSADLADVRAPYPAATFPFTTWMAIYALSGFIALSLEIVWFRIIGVVIKSNAFTFGTLLAIYLAGVGLGALVADRSRLERLAAARAFFALQSAIPLYAAAAMTLFVAEVGRIAALSSLREYMAGSFSLSINEGLSAPNVMLFVTLYALVPIFLVGPPTVMMGMSFTYLQRAVQTDLAALGRRVGWLQAANITGSMLGALLTGLITLQWLGSAGTLRMLLALGGVFLVIAISSVLLRKGALILFAAGLAALLFAAVKVPGTQVLWARVHGGSPLDVLIGEDRSGLSLLKIHPNGRETIVFVNGVAQSSLPYGGIHTALGALPALIHPKPARVAVIGLGSADTLFGIGGRAETSTIESIEIITPQLETLKRLDRLGQYPGLHAVLEDARVTHYFTDGRAFLMKQPAAYDIIEADALRPNSSLAGNLYSIEYFTLLRERLKPGGLAVTWCPTGRVRDTFVKVFPHVLMLGVIAIGSDTPIPFDQAMLRGRMQTPLTQKYYVAGGVDLEYLLAEYLGSQPAVFGPEFDRAGLTDVNRDLFPKDEFMVPLATDASRTRR